MYIFSTHLYLLSLSCFHKSKNNKKHLNFAPFSLSFSLSSLFVVFLLFIVMTAGYPFHTFLSFSHTHSLIIFLSLFSYKNFNERHTPIKMKKNKKFQNTHTQDDTFFSILIQLHIRVHHDFFLHKRILSRPRYSDNDNGDVIIFKQHFFLLTISFT